MCSGSVCFSTKIQIQFTFSFHFTGKTQKGVQCVFGQRVKRTLSVGKSSEMAPKDDPETSALKKELTDLIAKFKVKTIWISVDFT